MPGILIATPTPGTVRTRFTRTLAATILDLSKNGIAVDYLPMEGGDLIYQRSMIATQFLRSKFSHLLFVDSDMDFAGDLGRRLLSHDKPMIGAAYRTKGDRAHWHVYFTNGFASVVNGISPAEAVALGAALIRRDVFETMVERKVARLIGDRYNFFSPRNDDSEDISFCRRWRIDCGGEIWALLDARIGHIGDYAYGADQSYLDYLKEKGALTPQGG